MKTLISLFALFFVVAACDKSKTHIKTNLTPKPFTYEDLQKKIDISDFSMNWNFKKLGGISYTHKKGQTYSTLTLAKFLRDRLNNPEAFTCKDQICTLSVGPQKKQEKNPYSGGEDYPYLLNEPLVLSEQNPTQITVEDLTVFMKEQKHIFYTGAGISAGTVETMTQLEEKVFPGPKFEASNPMPFIEARIANAESSRLKMYEFYQHMLFGEPTQAHWDLKEIALSTEAGIVTENLDLLQHRTGIEPLGPPNLKSFKKEDYRGLKYLICVGLSHDDRGFISWLKKLNPKLKVIALDIQQPRYLSSEDFLLKGDLKAVLTEVKKKVI